MPRGGKRAGSGQPRKTPLPKIRRDVAFEVIDILNEPLAKNAKRGTISPLRKAASGEAAIVLGLIEQATDQRLKWDVYRYAKECLDGKPMVRSEEKVSFDPNQPMRVVIEHIGRPS